MELLDPDTLFEIFLQGGVILYPAACYQRDQFLEHISSVSLLK